MVAARSCDDCKRWLYDDVQADGTVKWKSKPMERHGKPVPRPTIDGIGPPCHLCPKESPEKAEGMKLSAENLQLFRFYKRIRATGGKMLTKRMLRDELLIDALAIVDELVRAHDLSQGSLTIL